jgi:ABC-type uncharacterized transport system substrate-binding protein
MRRRDFISLVGGSAAVWPLAARAQSERMRRIAFLSPGPQAAARNLKWKAEFEGALGKVGWTIGRNLQIDYRWGANNPGLREQAARELLALAPEAFLAVTPAVAGTLLQETRTIPIVFLDGPEASIRRFIPDWSRPGGNITGFINFVDSIFGKWLELLREISPRMYRVAYLLNPDTTLPTSYSLGDLEAAARLLALETVAAPVHDDAAIDAAFATLATDPRGGAIILPNPFAATHQDAIFAAANRFAVPVVYPFRYYVENGGLLSYGVDESDLYRGAASYIDRILRGENPADLPVQAPSRFELVVNLKVAKSIGIDMPTSIVLRADAFIE